MANGTASLGGNSSHPEADSKAHVLDVSIGPGIVRHRDTQSKDLAASLPLLTTLGSSCPTPCAVHHPSQFSRDLSSVFPTLLVLSGKPACREQYPLPSVHKAVEHLRTMLIKVIIWCRCAVPVLNYASVRRQHFQQVRAGSTGVTHRWASRAVWGWRSCARALGSVVLLFLGVSSRNQDHLGNAFICRELQLWIGASLHLLLPDSEASQPHFSLS